MSDTIYTDNSKVIADLQAQNDALVARVGVLSMLLEVGVANLNDEDDLWSKEAVQALNETESESLAEIKAAEIEYAAKNLEAIAIDGHLMQRHSDFIEYANQLRKQGKDHD